MPASQESPAGTAPSVLLVEEYDALGAAITSALKKFAPRHRVRAVESLTEAEASMAETRPQLLIVDFDPPRFDAVEFVERIAAANPSARFLAIASGVPPEMKAQRYGPNALQFIEKPFDLAEFGAAVQALLGPWTKAASGDSRGTLRDLNVRDVVPLQCLNLVSSVLHVHSADDRSGEIHFVDGQITHATAGNFTGAGALHQMMRWKKPRFRETERVLDAPRTIHGSWCQVFLEALRKTAGPAEEPAPVPVQPVIPEPPKKAAAKTGKKIVVIDDTEMLLIFVEDALTTAEPNLQIITAFTGSEGVRRAEVMIPDLVLLDYSLPDLHGDQVCERLLQNEATAGIPVIMMSGHVVEMTAAALKYPNIVATIAKPFMSEALVALVNETLSKGPLALGAPPRFGNGKEPEKKNGAGAAKPVVEKQTVPAPSPAVPLPAATAPVAPPEAPESVAPFYSAPPPMTPLAEAPVQPAPQPVAPPPIAALAEAPVQPAPQPVALPPTAALPEPPVQPVPQPVAPPPMASWPETPPPVAAPPAPPPRPAEPLLATPPPAVSQVQPPSPAPARLASSNGSSVMLGLGMEVIAVQFTPRFQIGTIRARPTASTLSLTHSSAPAENLLAGFEIGPVELDQEGRIRTMRVLPTRQPAKRIESRNGFAINEVALLNQNASIQLTAGESAPMTMQMVAVFKVAGVELSDQFEVAQLVLQPAGNRVRVTLDPRASTPGGTEFETLQVRLDASNRIAEFVLNAVGR